MTDNELDHLMRNILLDAIALDEESCKEDRTFEPSLKHQRQMTAMLANPWKWAHSRARPVWKKALQKIAVIFLTFSLGLGSLMAVSPTVRATVARWVTKRYETHITYRYSGEQNTDEMPRYGISALPDGYEEVSEERIEETNYIQVAYQNSLHPNSQTIYFDYTYMQQGSGADYSTENSNVLQVSVNGMQGILFVAEDVENMWSTLTWVDERADLQFSIDAAMKSDDIIHMAESVKLVEMPK